MELPAKVVVVEPFESVYRLLKMEKRWDVAADYEHLVRIRSKDLRLKLSAEVDILDLEEIKILIYPTYKGIDLLEEKNFYQAIRDVSWRIILSKNTDIFMKESKVANLIRNTKYMIKNATVRGLSEVLSGQTAVVVSAGPSLSKNIDLLRPYADRVVIITGGRSMKTLLEKGIEPHLVCSVDSHQDNYRLYKNFQLLQERTPMVSTWGNHERIVAEYEGVKVFVNDSGLKNLDLLLLDEVIQPLSIGLTVASLQLSIAVYMGCETVIFVGQDMAFDGDQRYGKELLAGLGDWESEKDEIFYVKGNWEEKVQTSMDLDSFRIFLEELISAYQKEKPHLRFINSTQGGAYMQGTQVVPLSESLERYAALKAVDFDQKIRDGIANSMLKGSHEHLRTAMQEMIDHGKTLYRYCKEAKTLSDRLLHPKLAQSAICRIDVLEKKIKKIRESVPMMDHYLSEEMDEVIRRSFGKQEEKTVVENHRLLYGAMADAVQSINQLLQSEVESLEKMTELYEDSIERVSSDRYNE